MIVITKIEYMTTELDEHEIFSMQAPYNATEVFTHDGAKVVSAECIRHEIVKGRRFRTWGGKDVVLGLSSQAQEALQMQYEAFDNLQKSIDDMEKVIKTQTEIISGFRRVKMLQKIKWVFTDMKQWMPPSKSNKLN